MLRIQVVGQRHRPLRGRCSGDSFRGTIERARTVLDRLKQTGLLAMPNSVVRQMGAALSAAQYGCKHYDSYLTHSTV